MKEIKEYIKNNIESYIDDKIGIMVIKDSWNDEGINEFCISNLSEGINTIADAIATHINDEAYDIATDMLEDMLEDYVLKRLIEGDD